MHTRPRPLLEEMEARVLYSADLLPAVIDAGASAVVEQRTLASDGEFAGAAVQSAAAAHEAQTHELVFVDASIPHAEELIADIGRNQSAQRQVEVVRIASDADGIAAISDVLSQRHDVDAVHIIGHGRDGEVQLGAARLDFESLLENATRIKRWGEALNENADVLLYGCDVAQSEAGRALVDALSRLTGADVGASDNPTGSERLGGDWNLEYQAGTVETGVVVSAAEQHIWDGLLDDPVPASDAVSPVAPAVSEASAQTAALAAVPLAFEQNVGQADAQVDFLARGSGYGVWLTGGDAVLSVGQGDGARVVGLNVVGRNTALIAQGDGQTDAKTNYFIGDPEQWRTDVANFNAVRYDNVYDGIDLRYYGNQRQLEYDFIVRAGADANAIQLRFDGAQNQTIADNGDLVLTLDDAGNTISFKAPVAYQEGANGREAVDSRYVLAADGTVSFALGAYDHGKELVIDPVLSYASYFGGNGVDNPNGLAVDAAGYVYITGYTSSTNMPLFGGLFGGQDVFVAKFTPDLSGLVYAAYVGGNLTDQSNAIAVDASGNAYVTGHTQSSNFPTVAAYQSTRSGSEDAFLFKLNAAGNGLLFSTYFGGNGNGDDGVAVAVDATGAAYVAGDTNSSSLFPITFGAFDTSYAGGDAFVAKFNPSGTLAYSTFLGGSLSDGATGIAVDGSGNAVVVGQTSSSNFPTTASAYPNTGSGGTEVFVTKLNSTGTALLYSTYLGGGKTDIAFAVALGPTGKIYVTGETNSNDFVVTAGAFQIANAGSEYDAFMAIVDPTASGSASLVYSTYLGGSGKNEAGLGIAVDGAGRAYVAGYSDSNGSSQGLDVFVAQINPGSAGAADLLYYSFLGSSGQDRANAAAYHDGKFIIAGDTAAISGIATPGAYDTTYNGGSRDSFVAIYTFDSPPVVAVNTTPLAYVENAGAVMVDGTLTVADGDSANLAGAIVQITNNYVPGEDLLGFDNANPWGITGVWNAAAATMTLSGSASVASYQAALRSITYQNSSERPSTLTRTVSFAAADGTQSSARVDRQITVASIDDAPVNTVPGAQTIAEDTALVFSTANANPISVGDVDAATGAIQVTLTAANGKLTLAQTTGLTFVTGNGIGNQTMTFTGTLASINTALDGLRFDPTPDYNGAAGVQLVTNDQGNTGSGGPLNATSSIPISINGVNDAPINNLPGPQTTPQDTALMLSSGNGNAITVGDVDAGSGMLKITLSATNGTVSLGSLTGLTGVAGNGSASVTFSGSITDLNGALNGLSFTPTFGYGGPASLVIATNDLGNSGSGGPATATDTLAITVSGNVAPTVGTSAGALAYTEQAAPAAIDAGLTVNDADTPLLNHAVVRIAANYVGGEDLLAFADQLGIAGAWDAASGTLMLSGAASAGDYQTALRSVTYHNVSDNPSTAMRTLSFVVNDGNADSAIATRQIAVSAVNDPPSIAAPGLQSSPEDAPLMFSAANANQISIADPDAGASPVTLSLSAIKGTLTLAQSNGLVIAAGADGSSAMTLTGTVDDLNAALNGLAFAPAADATGAARIDLTLDDNGNTGTGGNGTTSASVLITLTSVNDAPSGTPKTVTTKEDTPYVFAATDFGFSDAQDVPANLLAAVRITALPPAGTLTDDGIAVVAGQNVTVADINAGKLVFSPGLDAHGAGYASFTFQVRDDGGTANGGIDLDQTPRSMTIDVTALNDAPVGIDVAVTAFENSAYTFAVADFGFNDPNDAPANNLLGVYLASLPTAGSLTLAGASVPVGAFISSAGIAAGDLKFTPASGAYGAAYSTFSFRLQDDGGTADGGVDLEATPHTMTVDVTEVNQAPQGTDKIVSLLEDTPYVLAAADFGFSDSGNSVPNQLLAVKFASVAGAGTLRDNGVAVNAGDTVSAADIALGRLIFMPGANASGAGYASFGFQVQDDGGTANGGVDLDPTSNTLTIDVAAVNDAPAGADGTVTTLEDTPYTFVLADFAFGDPSDTPANNLVAIKVDSVSGAGSLTLSGSAVVAGQTISAANINAGAFKFTPVANASGAGYGSFSFRVQDDGGTANGGVDLAALAHTMTVDVTAINDVPSLAVNSGASDVPGGTVVISGAMLSVTDIDNTPAQIVYTVTALPSSGTLLLAGAPMALNDTFTQAQVGGGMLQYMNTGMAAAADGFGFSVADGAGGAIGPTSFSITVAFPPVPPTVLTVVAPTPAPTTSTNPVPSAPAPGAPAPVAPAPPPMIALPGPDASGPAAPPAASEPIAPAASESAQEASSAGSNATSAEAAPGAARSAGAADRASSSASERRMVLMSAPALKAELQTLLLSPPVSEPTLTAATLNVNGMDPQFGHSPETLSLEAYQATLRNDHWVNELNRMRDAVDGQIRIEHQVMASSVAITGGLSVGYVIWLLRGGLLLSSLLSSLPAWHVIDPMPVLARSGPRQDDSGVEDDPLENLFGKAKAAIGLGRAGAEVNSAAAVAEHDAEPLRTTDNPLPTGAT